MCKLAMADTKLPAMPCLICTVHRCGEWTESRQEWKRNKKV